MYYIILTLCIKYFVCIFRITISTLLLTILVHWTVWEFFFFFFFTVLRFFSLRVHLTRECTDTLLCFKSLETALLYEFRPTNLYQIKIFFSLFYRNLIFSLFYYLSVGIKFIQRSLASIPTPFSCVYSSSMLHFEILYDCYEDALI